MWAANPCSCRIFAVLIEKTTLKHKHFLTAPMRMQIELRVRRCTQESYLLALVFMQSQDLKAGHQARRPLSRFRVDNKFCLVIGLELLQLDEYEAALLTDLG